MNKSFLTLVIGNLDEKRAYRQMEKRIRALPKDYRFTYKAIRNYGYNVGFGHAAQENLLELFEDSSAAGLSVLAVVGKDVAAFSDELMLAGAAEAGTARENLNKEILAHFGRKAG